MKPTPLGALRAAFCLALLVAATYGLYGHFEKKAVAEANRQWIWHPCQGIGLTNCDWSTPAAHPAPDYAMVWWQTGLSIAAIIAAGILLVRMVRNWRQGNS